MGLRINVDLETSGGPTQELYVRLDTLNLNKVASKIKYVVSYWIDKDHALRFNRTYLEQPRPGANGILAREVVYYENEESEGIELTLPLAFEAYPVSKQVITLPVFEMKPTVVEVPYISFDENGDEVTKYRKIEEEKRVEVGTKEEERHIIDNEKLFNIQETCYDDLRIKLTEFFPEDSIENA